MSIDIRDALSPTMPHHINNSSFWVPGMCILDAMTHSKCSCPLATSACNTNTLPGLVRVSPVHKKSCRVEMGIEMQLEQ